MEHGKMTSVVLMSVLLASALGAHVPAARAEGTAYCDVVSTKCAGAAAAVVAVCASGTYSLGLFGGPQEFRVCTGAAGAAAAATSIRIGSSLAASTYAGNTAWPGYWHCVNHDVAREISLAWAWIECTSTATGECVYAEASAKASNVAGSLPAAQGGAAKCVQAARSLVQTVCDATQIGFVVRAEHYIPSQWEDPETEEPGLEYRLPACQDARLMAGGEIHDAIWEQLEPELFAAAYASSILPEGIQDDAMRAHLARLVVEDLRGDSFTYTLHPVMT